MSQSRPFSDLVEQARALRAGYARLEATTHGRSWTRQEVMLGFLGDVGDLAKLVQAAEGIRNMDGAEARLAHELADCLWSVMVLADLYGVDLEASFEATMAELQKGVEDRLAAAAVAARDAD